MAKKDSSMVVVELENTSGKTFTERVKAASLDLAENIALRRHKNCTVIDSSFDMKDRRRASGKDRW